MKNMNSPISRASRITFPPNHAMLSATLGHMGRPGDARAALGFRPRGGQGLGGPRGRQVRRKSARQGKEYHDPGDSHEWRPRSVAAQPAGLSYLVWVETPTNPLLSIVDITALAALCAATSYFLLTQYERIAVRHVGSDLPYSRIAVTSFISYAVGHNVGMSALSGGAIRFRTRDPIRLLDDGRDFGAPGFVRLNFGCPRSMLTEALDRMARAVQRRP